MKEILDRINVEIGCITSALIDFANSIKLGLLGTANILELENTLSALTGKYFECIKKDLKILSERSGKPYCEFLKAAIEKAIDGAPPEVILEYYDSLVCKNSLRGEFEK